TLNYGTFDTESLETPSLLDDEDLVIISAVETEKPEDASSEAVFILQSETGVQVISIDAILLDEEINQIDGDFE
ncbi:hypothetical protein, partial [Dulcicalothrix desertica]